MTWLTTRVGVGLLAVAMLAVACGRSTGSSPSDASAGTPDAAGGGSGGGDVGGRGGDAGGRGGSGGSGASADAGLADAPFEIVEAGGDCAPGPLTAGYERNSCCAGKPCIGMCVRNNQGSEWCWCMGIDGGCTLDAGQVCCAGGFVTGCSAKNKACGLGL